MKTQPPPRRPGIALATTSALLLGRIALPAVDAAPVAHLSRTRVDFGYVSRNTTSPAQPVFVTNIGDAPLAIAAIALGGTVDPVLTTPIFMPSPEWLDLPPQRFSTCGSHSDSSGR